MQTFPIQITQTALNQIAQILPEVLERQLTVNNPGFLRINVVGGGCSGFSYQFVSAEKIEEDDYVYPNEIFHVLIDSLSATMLQGATLDWKESLSGSNFIVTNPNAASTCGCGSSFSV